ncbi:MAG: alpha/beta hydrolase [Myxococcales bacterium]|nr:alpha/beta hydrolase [Myxococcales bacterium]
MHPAAVARLLGRSMMGLAATAARRLARGPAVPEWSLLYETAARLGRARMATLDLAHAPRARAQFAELGALARLPRGVRVEPATVGGVPAEWLVPEGADGARVVVYFHGGGYVIGAPATARELAARIACAAGARALSVDYRLAPEHPFPAAVDDACAVYRALGASGIEPGHVALAGDSAGGGLALALLLRLRAAGEALPACAALLCPWVDLSDPCAEDAGLDDLPQRTIQAMARLYLGGASPQEPLASPVFGELAGLPPLLVQAGGVEVLRPQIERLAARVAAAGGEVALEVAPGMVHVWHLLAAVSPEARAAIARIGAFVRAHA